jgi:hypothetical protein
MNDDDKCRWIVGKIMRFIKRKKNKKESESESE